jgi:hypothetical protein
MRARRASGAPFSAEGAMATSRAGWKKIISRLFAAATLGALSPAMASEFVSFDLENFNAIELAAFERAVGLNPADPKDGDQVRIWYDSVMNGRVSSYVVTPEGARRCRLRYLNDGEGKHIERGDCGVLRRHRAEAAKAMALLAEVAALDGRQAFCDRVLDGWMGNVSGVIAGRKFEFAIGNNDECEDADSKLINRLSDLIAAAYDPKSAL